MDFLAHFALDYQRTHFTLLHVFRKPSASEELMGEEYMQEKMPAKINAILQDAKNMLVERGFPEENIDIQFSTHPYPTITDGIIDHYDQGAYDVVVIGRKDMSKAEEFVMGDISVRLVRALKGAAVLIVKSKGGIRCQG
jgi:nucleotide-binding universal stress UspA family protein